MSYDFHTRDWVRRNFGDPSHRGGRFRPPEVIDRSDLAADPPMTGVFQPIAEDLSERHPDLYAYALAVRNYRMNEDRKLLTKQQQRRMRRIETGRDLWKQMSG